MPQLKSGRHITISASPLLDQIKSGSDESAYAAIMTFRLAVTSPEQLREYLAIGYFREGEGTPPNAPSYHSGFVIKDVFEGKADWSQDEIREFEDWLNNNPKIGGWLAAQFDEINSTIRDNPVWTSALLSDDDPQETRL